MSFQQTSVENGFLTSLIFVVSAVGSIIYVRCWYYPWLISKKRDPLLPTFAPHKQNPTVESSPSMMLNLVPMGDFIILNRK